MIKTTYDTFGNEVKYYVDQDTLHAYVENATAKFPVPPASSEVLSTLIEGNPINHVELDIVIGKLHQLGFEPVAGKIMATVLINVAQDQGISPLAYFDDEDLALKLANDTYQIINMMRPLGNQVGVTTVRRNNRSRFAKLIRP